MGKVFKVADIRDLEQKVALGEMSYSRMVEVLNEKAEEHYSKVKKLNTPVVSNNEALEFCDGVAFANYIEEKWKEYRTFTNNEDAWCFKQWLVGK